MGEKDKDKDKEKENQYSLDERKKQIKKVRATRQQIMDELFEEGTKRYHQRN